MHVPGIKLPNNPPLVGDVVYTSKYVYYYNCNDYWTRTSLLLSPQERLESMSPIQVKLAEIVRKYNDLKNVPAQVGGRRAHKNSGSFVFDPKSMKDKN